MLSHEEKIRIQQKKKKILITAVLIVVGIFVLVGISLLILSAIQQYIQETKIQEYETPRYSYVYPDTDWDRNIFEESYYMGFDRSIKYNDGIATTTISEENKTSYPAEVQYMYDVVNLIINGDYEEYNKIFADEYWELISKEDLLMRQLGFTMQPLYDIEIANVSSTESETNIDVQLSYKIYKNDGTFRNDMSYDDGEILPVIYRLVTDSTGQIKVLNISKVRISFE